MKKLFVTLLAIVMIFAMAAPAFAAEDELGSITMNNVIDDATYDIYRILDLESYNPATGAYSYKINADWADFFATPEALAYVAIDNAGYVTWINGDDAASIAAFAKIALEYAKNNDIAPVKSSAVDGDMIKTENAETGKTEGKFADLPLGWYLVDSTVGALCGLTTTNPHASVNAKNGIPTIDKQVQEDSTQQWGDQNNADLYEKPMVGTALCLPQTIGSTTGGMVLYCANMMKRNPACMLFSEHIDSLACAGAVLAAVWADEPMVTVDCLGQEFLDYVKDGMKITVDEDGTVTVE